MEQDETRGLALATNAMLMALIAEMQKAGMSGAIIRDAHERALHSLETLPQDSAAHLARVILEAMLGPPRRP
jgi:hypothetical protein